MMLILLFIFLTYLPLSAQDYDLQKSELLISETKKIYAPDKRTSIFNINSLRKDSLIILFGETNLPDAEKYLLEKLKEEKIGYYNNIALLPSDKLKGKIFGVINLSAANIRTENKHWSEMSNQAMLGTVVKVFRKLNGWLLIQTPDEYIGWTEDDAVQLMDEKELNTWRQAPKIIFTEITGTCFSEPDEASVPVSDVILGNILCSLGTKGNFIKAEFPDKRFGYIPEKSAADYREWINMLKPSAEGIIKTAEKFIGIPYLWGGTSIKGLDCSGFTKITFLLNGIELPRDASQQINVGEEVDTKNGFENLQPGDLLFFGSKAKGNIPDKIHHVAIYSGNNEFIHSSGMIRINSFDKTKANYSSYRFNTFIKAKRIITSLNRNGVKPIIDFAE